LNEKRADRFRLPFPTNLYLFPSKHNCTYLLKIKICQNLSFAQKSVNARLKIGGGLIKKNYDNLTTKKYNNLSKYTLLQSVQQVQRLADTRPFWSNSQGGLEMEATRE